MNRLYKYLNFAALILVTGFLFSCGDDDEIILTRYNDGVYVINEGNFNEGDGSISHYSPSAGTTAYNIFSTVNNEPLGDVAQSMSGSNGTAYIVVNNSNKVEVVETETMKRITTIDAALPRYVAIGEGVGYLTEWVQFGQNGRVSVIDLNTNSITNTIEVGQGPEFPLLIEDELWVSNTLESTISVINIDTEEVVNTIEVGNGIGHMAIDMDGMVWAITGGGYDDSWIPLNDGGLHKIDPKTGTVVKSYPFDTNTSSKFAISRTKNVIYYTIGNNVYAMNINDADLPTYALISDHNIVGLYGIGVDPNSGFIYLADSKGLQSTGKVYYYETDGVLIDSFDTGRAPNGFMFFD